MSFMAIAAMGLGGAALGALANPDDRKKGALMGLGAGLLAPVAAPMMGIGGAAGAAGAGTAGAVGAGTAGAATGAVAPVMTTGISGAGVAGMGAAPTVLAAPTVAAMPAASSMAAPVGIQSVLPGAAINTSTGIAHTGTMASKIGASKLGAMTNAAMGKAGEALTSDTAKTIAAQGAIGLMKPQQKAQIQQGPSLALKGSGQEQVSPYQRAALNRQQRMKQAGGGGPRRFI